MLTEETNNKLNTAPANPETEIANEESAPEETGKGNWREAFRAAFDRARRQQKPAESRQELGRDKSKSLFLLVGVCVALLLLFFGVFSHPKKKIALPGENPRGEASLGRKVTPGQENSDPTKAATPMLSADVRSTDPALAGQLTPEDIDRTSRTGMASKPTAGSPTASKPAQDYALSKVDFSDPSVGHGTTIPNPPSPSASDSTADLKKPSLVFVRSTEIKPALRPNSPEETDETLALAAGTVTIIGLWSHSGTGEEWADDDNGMTSADAQAFKRACSCFGLGRYFYDFPAIWVDLDHSRQPVRAPMLSAWALPENWRKGMRPPSKNGNGKAGNGSQGAGPNGASNDNHGQAGGHPTQPTNGNSNGQGPTRKANGSSAAAQADDLDERILRMEKAVGTTFYRSVLREYGRVNQPKLIRDAIIKRKVLQMLESVARGIDRLEAVTKRLDPKTVTALLAKLQAPPLGEISDLKTLQHIVFGLEEIAGPHQPHAA